jgi:SHS family lactate transporter-like MFS transporter
VAWQQHRASSTRAIFAIVTEHWKSALYLVLMMTLMMFLSHGSQDLYPDFLRSMHGASSSTVAYIAMLYNVGAVLGAITFGQLSEIWGRRRSMIAALILSLLIIPAWTYAATMLVIAISAFLMQAGVQGAWGVIPAHLNELSPHETRGLLPGLAYQLGILIAAPVNTIAFALRARIGYRGALATFESATIVFLMIVLALGREHKGRDFLEDSTP